MVGVSVASACTITRQIQRPSFLATIFAFTDPELPRSSCRSRAALTAASAAATLSRLAYRWRLTRQPQQVGKVHRQPPRLIARQPIWSPSGATQRYVRNRGRSGSARLALETTFTPLRTSALAVPSNLNAARRAGRSSSERLITDAVPVANRKSEGETKAKGAPLVESASALSDRMGQSYLGRSQHRFWLVPRRFDATE